MGRSKKKSTKLAAQAVELIGVTPKKRRRGRKLLLAALLGLGAAAFKASRSSSGAPAAAPARTPAPTPAPTPAEPAPVEALAPETPAEVATPAVTPPVAIPDIPQVQEVAPSDEARELTTEVPTLPKPTDDVVAVPEPLPEPVLAADEPTEIIAAVPGADQADQAGQSEPTEVAGEAEEPAEQLDDIVEEPWAADAEVTPIPDPPADSLTSFFDEVMTDTAERKQRKGR